MGSGDGEEGRGMRELAMKGGEDLTREEEGGEVMTGEDLLAEEIMQVNTAGKVVVRGNIR